MRHDIIETEHAGTPGGLSMEACDDADGPLRQARDPSACIAQFCRLMVLQGRVVSPALMRADREYALWQLARARAADDEQLHSLAGQLFTWLDGRDSRLGRPVGKTGEAPVAARANPSIRR